MLLARSVLLVLIAVAFPMGFAHAKCPPDDPHCVDFESHFEKGAKDAAPTAERSGHDAGHVIEKTGKDAGNFFDKGLQDSQIATVDNGVPLQPVRAYLRAKEIPPPGIGAYGLVVFHSKATPASRSKLLMVCRSFVAFFPRSETSSASAKDQMVTIWPLENPDSKQAKKDDCDYAVDDYDLVASEAAITDATRQHGNFDGEGPFLVGWSPSNSRAIPDAVVLVIDMSKDNGQAEIDNEFRFWKNEIVKDPSKWRNSWSVEAVRGALRIFADHYGPALLESVKFFGGKT